MFWNERLDCYWVYNGSSISDEILVGELLPDMLSDSQNIPIRLYEFLNSCKKLVEVSFDFLLVNRHPLKL